MLHVKVLSISLIISSSVLKSTKPDRQQSKCQKGRESNVFDHLPWILIPCSDVFKQALYIRYYSSSLSSVQFTSCLFRNCRQGG